MYEIVQPPYEARFSTLLLFYPAETDNDKEKSSWLLRNKVSFDASGRVDKKSVESVSNTHAHAGTDSGQELPDIIGHVSQNEGSIYLFRKKIVEFLIKNNCTTVTFIPAHYVRDDTNKKRAKDGEYFFAILNQGIHSWPDRIEKTPEEAASPAISRLGKRFYYLTRKEFGSKPLASIAEDHLIWRDSETGIMFCNEEFHDFIQENGITGWSYEKVETV